jgi:FeS assembly SUF system protein
MTEELTQMDPDRMKVIEEKVVDCLKSIFDPEIPVNIYELGLIYEVQVTPFGDVHVTMTLTSPNCPVAGSLPNEVKGKISIIPEVREADVEITFEPPWTQDMMSEEAKLELGFM